MSTVKNKVNIKQNGENIRSLTQKVSMAGEVGNGNGTIMQFVGKFPSDDEKDSSLKEKSIFSLIKEDNNIKVKIELPSIFKDKNGNSLSSNSEIVKDLDNLILNVGEDNNNLNRPVTFTEQHGGLIVKIKSKDGQDYTITSTPTSISIDYGSSSYTYSTQNESCIDVNMTTDVAKGIFSENSEYSNYFKTPDSLNNIPSHIFGLYATNLKGTNKIQLGSYTIFSFDFAGENTKQPNIFVSQPDGKLFFFNSGKFYRCKEYFFQYNQATKEPALIVGTTYNKYFKFNVKTEKENDQLSLSNDYEQLISFFKNNGVTYNSNNDAITRDEDKIKIKCGENIFEFLPEDKREYEPQRFKIKPDTINFNLIDKTPIDIPPIFIQINNFYENFITFYNSHKEYQQILLNVYKNITSLHEEIDLTINSIDNMTIEINELNNVIQNFSNRINDIYNEFHLFFEQHPTDKDVIEIHNEITNIYNIYKDTYIKKDKDPVEPEKPKEEQKQEQKEEPEKESEEEKEKKHFDFKKPVENLGNISMLLGIFLMIGAMIPGVGAIFATIGAVLTGLGAAGVVFADKFVWDPYEKAKRDLNSEQYETLEDDFFENENELDKLHEQTAEKFADLDKLIQSEIEDGGNFVAREFADLYNKYGVGFPEINEKGQSRFEQLESMEGFAIRRGIYDQEGKSIIHEGLIDQLKAINLLSNDQKERANLINKFINDNFKEVESEDRARLIDLFEPKNQAFLTEFIDVFSKAHSAQEVERKLFIDQQRFLGGEDEGISTDRISRLVSYSKLTPESRKAFFERYGESILKYYSVQDKTSYQQINSLVDRVPVEERKEILAILDQKYDNIKKAQESIKETAKDNVTKIDRLEEQRQYAISINDLTQNKDNGYDLMNETEYTNSVNNYLQEYTLAYYNNNTNISNMQQMRKGVEHPNYLDSHTQQINQVMMTTADSFFAEPKSNTSTKYAKTLYDATQRFYKSCENFGIAKEVAELYRAGTDISSIVPSPENTNTNSECTIQKVATRLASEVVSEFESQYTVTGKSVQDKTGKKVSVATEPLKTQFSRYSQAKEVIESSKALTSLQTSQERGQAKQFSEIEKIVAQADASLTIDMLKDPNNPLNAQYKKLIQEFRKKSPAYISDKQIEALARTQIHLDRLRENAQKYSDKNNPEYNPNTFAEYSAVYSNVENYMRAYMNGGLNALVVANAHNHAMGHGDYTYSRESLGNAGKVITDQLTRENSVNELIGRFNTKDQNSIRDYMEIGLMAGDKPTSELLIEALKKNLGERTVEAHAPTYDNYRESFVKEGQPLNIDALENDTLAQIDSMNARSQRELSTHEDLLRECRGNWGRDFIARQYEQERRNVREQNNPVIEYNSPLDILEKRFGIDRDKLIAEIETAQKSNPNMDGNFFINNLLKKFGLNKELYDKAIKALPKEAQKFDFTKSLSADDKTKIEVDNQTKKSEDIKTKTEMFNGLWANVENGTSYEEFIAFFKDKNNFEYIEQLNLSYQMVDVEIPTGSGKTISKQRQYDIITLLQDKSISDDERLEKIKNIGSAFNLKDAGNDIYQKAEIDLKEVKDERNAKNSKEVSIAEQEADIQRFDITSKNFNRLWANLKEHPNDEYVQKAFLAFCNSNNGSEFVNNLNLNDRFVIDITVLLGNHSISNEDKINALTEYENDFNVMNATQKARDYKKYQLDLLTAKNKKEKDFLTAKYNLNLTKESAKKFNSLWSEVKLSLDEDSINKFVEFLNNNPEFTNKLNLPKSNSGEYEIIKYLQTFTKNSKDDLKDDPLPVKLRRLQDYEKQFKVNVIADNLVTAEEQTVETLEIKAQAQTEEEFDVIDSGDKLAQFDKIQKDLFDNLSAIVNIDNNTYSENDINQAINAFLNGDYNTLSKFNINYDEVQFVNYQAMIAKLEELGNVDTSKYKGKIKKSIIKSLETIKTQISKTIKQIKKLFERLRAPQTDYIQTIRQISKHLQSLRNDIYNAQKNAEKAFGKKIKTSTTLTDSQLMDNLAINAGMIKSREEKERKKREQLEREGLEREQAREMEDENNREEEQAEENE